MKKGLTSVVPASHARSTTGLSAGNAAFDGNPVSDFPLFDSGTHLDDFTGRFMASTASVSDDHSGTNLAMLPEMNVGTEARGQINNQREDSKKKLQQLTRRYQWL